ncbi:hypothetical protein DYB31_001402 [Aphanomyces astaci]|uniref:V-SNARE coiled-coil homology domain-containing protein n=3 Tax=Aphanomyces astaci TaxID=112090 RepID=A0A397F368_APHAT|nr:hypothetical protein DYB31_001402 [Aphanomyces astaci]
MPISYAMIARDLAVLCEYTDEPVDTEPAKFAHAVLRDIVDKAHPTETRNVFTMGKRVYYYYLFDGLTYICMCDETFQREAAYAMLEETKNEFLSRSGHRSKTPKDFAPHLHAIMTKYENVKIRTKIDVVNVTDQVKEVKNKMADSLHRLLERGVKMNDLVTKTEKLHHDALVFQQSSTKLKNVLWWKNIKYQLLALVLFAVLMWIGASWICGWDMSSCGSNTRNIPMIRDISHSVSSGIDSAQHGIESTVDSAQQQVGGTIDKAKGVAADALHR